MGIKNDLDLERLCSGRFESTEPVCVLGAPARRGNG